MVNIRFSWLSTLAKVLIVVFFAISILPAPLLGQEVIIDNDDSGTSFTGGYWGYSSGANPYDGSSRAEKQAGATYTFQSAVTGNQVVSLWWTYWASRCTTVPVDIYDGNTLLDTVTVNQLRLDLAGDWNVLGAYNFNNAARVVIRAQSGCSANADAVRFEGTAPPVLSYIEVTGATSVNENSSADYDCIAHYEDGSSREVEADVWSENSVYADISSTGLLTTGEVTSSQTCIVSADYTENGITRNDDLGVTINDYVPPVELVIDNGDSGTSATGAWYESGGVPPIGADNLYSKTPGSIYSYQTPLDGYYEVHLYWTYWNSRCTSVPVRIYDGNQLIGSTTVNQLQNGGDWSMIGPSGYPFNGSARVEIQATSTSCSTCADAVKFVAVEAPELTSIVISGPASVNENSSVDFGCTAYYTDGSSHAVQPTWSEDSTYATISSTGLLTTTEVGSTQSCLISATYSENGITRVDDHAIIIENYVPPAEIIIDNDDPGTTAAGAPWGYSSGLNPYDGSSRAEKQAGATYTFQSEVTGNQVVSLWWTYWASRCTAVPVDIYDGNTLLATVPVNQQRIDLAGDWNVLGSYTFSNAARVVIRAQSGCSANADAVKFESAGPSMVAVPNCVNIAQASAQTLISNAGLVIGSVTTAHHASFPVGNVINTTPVGGTQVPVGSSVNLIVSDGPAPVPVPPCVGLTQAAAEAAIAAAGLTVGTVSEENSDTVAAGLVISQDPASGDVLPGSAVDLVVSLGQVPVAVPEVVGLTQTAAETAITDAGLTVGTVSEENSDTVAAGLVISQDPASGDVMPGSAVDLVVSSGPALVSVPDCVDLLHRHAEADVVAAGLVVGAVTCADSDTIPAGMVISQDPLPGGSVASGTAVDLVVSSGAASAPIVDNDFEGSVDSDDLIADDPCRDWYESKGTHPERVLLHDGTSVPVAGNATKMALLDGEEVSSALNPIGSAYLTQDFNPAPTGTFRISYDIFIDSIIERPGTSTDSTGFTYVGDNNGGTDGPNSGGTERFVYLGFYDGGSSDFSTGQYLKLAANNNGVDVTAANSLSYDTWYTITIDIDVADGTYDVTVDDTNGTATYIQKTGIPRNSPVNVESLSFYINGQGAQFGNGKYYVDNVTATSLGPVMVGVPDVVGQSQAAAEAAINAVDGLSVGDVTTVGSATVPAGEVISQAPVGGSSVAYGSTVGLVVSAGVQPDITIDTSFDGGDSTSIGPGPVVNGNEITFTLKEDNVLDGSCPYRYWFNFKVNNVAGKQITFNLTDIGGSCPVPFFTEATEENQVVYSCDGVTWNRFTDHSYSTDGNGTYTFTETFACDEVQVATFFPFSYTKMQDFIDTVSASEWVTVELLGTSTEGRDIELLTITNDDSPDADKEDIFIIGRQHAAENGGSYMIQGLIDFLISEDVDAATLRDQYTWYIVPMVNPDGVSLGKSRETSLGNDPNRDWGNSDSVEINIVRNRIDLIDSTEEIDFFIDWHTQMNDDRWHNFIYSPSGNTFFSILSDWTDLDTQSASGASSCSSIECSCRGYIMNNILYDPTFTFEPTPHLVTWTPDTLREQGVLVGYAINEYFGGAGGPLLVDSEFENSADSEALRENSPGQDWWESRNVVPSTALTLDETNVGGNSTKKAALKNFDSGGNAYVTQNFGTPQNGSFSVSVDMYIDRIKDDADYDRTGYIFIGTDGDGTNGPNSTSAERFVFLTFYDPTPDDTGNDLELRAREYDNDTNTPAPDQPWGVTSTWTPVASGLSYDTWYTITVDVHVGSGTYNVLVEDDTGLDVAHVTGIKKFEKYTGSNVTHISFHTGDQGSGDFYVDSVYQVVNLPDLSVSPTFLDFGTNQNTLTFVVENVGDEPFSWEASVDQPWVTAIVPDNSGGLMNIGDSVTVSVTIDRDLFGAALPDLNCRMWGAISDTGIPTGIFGPDLISDPNSLKNLATASTNNDGWGVAHYFELGGTPLITRGAEYAFHSDAYDDAVNAMAALSPQIALAHVRNCTSGCCEDGAETCDDPHPFHRDKNGKTWLFMHNGGIDKTVMRNLIGETYLEENWPNGSEVGFCDPGTYDNPNWDVVVDSELYFLFVLKSIEANGWNVQQGIIDAVTQMMDAISGSSETINFIMSDGLNVWGFRKGHDLAYYYEPLSGYAAVASQPSNPGGSESWTIMNDYQLVTLRPGQTPQVLDVRDPGTQYAATVTILNSNGESVNISVVADGPQPVTVPNTVNLPLAGAEDLLAAAGLVVGNIEYKYSPNITPGNVIIQSYTAGSQLAEGSAVDLVVCQSPVVIDNGDLGSTSSYGTWRPSSGPNPYGGESLYVSNDGTATYTWTFSPAVSGFYNVSMWWTALASRSTNIPVEIEYFNDAETVYINQRQNGGQWNSLGSYYYEAGNSYDVILKAVGGGDSNCADAVRFTKENILRHKFTVDLPGGDQMMPVMGDIDGDGVQEIVVAAGYYVVAIDGETGEIEWSVSGAAYTAVELVDLDGDGIPEILHGMKNSTGPRLRALNGDGTMRWTSAYLPGEEVALFPIVAHDLDGDGYPTIFFATQDYEPDPYSGNLNDYNGALVKLDHNGNVLDSTWIQKPCWGGLALGDANFDGSFEVYVGDRRDGYHDIPSNGMQAFDAHTLSTLWTRPDIHHSSPLPILADVTGNSNLEVVATKITLAGPILLNSETGSTLSDYSNMNLPTHGTPTVSDIDEDGNLEVIYSTSYPENAPKKFVVFDLVTGKIDFEASFDFWIAWPPSVGDVTGDGHMEIIVAAGSQEDSVGDTHDGDYPILIYNKDYQLIDIVELDIQAGQLTPARVFDTDSDGYNEVVVPGFNNKLMVYDTSAFTSTPPPNTWVQKYSNYRQGVPEYVELPFVPTVASILSTRMAFDAAPEIVDHHEVLKLEDEPDDAKGYSGYE